MADCAIYVLWDGTMALMEDRPELALGTDHYWVYPGGKVEPGEEPVDAMIRECQEETGCTPVRYALLDDQLVYGKNGWRTIAFIVWQWDGTPPAVTMGDRQARLGWFSPEHVAGPDDGHTAVVAIARLVEWATA